jgi:uncharacterized protein
MRFKIVLLFLGIVCFLNSTYAEVGYNEPWGKDADLTRKKEKPAAFQLSPQLSPLGWLAEKAILFHQNVLTKVDGPRSHFRPTSSRYMLLAIRHYGFFKGYIMGCDRLLRENEEKWVYRTVDINGKLFKYDPPVK